MDEFELTFLPKELPANVYTSTSKEMLDIYLPSYAEHPHLRIRKSGSKCEITNKQPVVEGDASHQYEATIPLTAEEFSDLETVKGRGYIKRAIYT